MKRELLTVYRQIKYNNLKETEIEQCKIFIHLLLQDCLIHLKCIALFKKEYSSKHLRKSIFTNKTFSKCLKYLQSSEIIEVSPSYMPDLYSRKYKLIFFLGDFRAKYETVELSKVNCEKFDLLNETLTLPCEEINKQVRFIKSLEMDYDKVYSVFSTLEAEYLKISSPKKKWDKLAHLKVMEGECLKFSSSKKFVASMDNFAGRVYNFFTNKSHELEKCFTLNGENLEYLDIKSSQVYFFTQIEKMPQIGDFGVDMSNIKIDPSFKEDVLNDDIYSIFQQELGIETRDKAKKQLLSFLYGDRRQKRIGTLFQRKYPDTFKTLRYLQNFATGMDKFENSRIKVFGGVKVQKRRNTFFNYLLQKFERDTIFSALKNMQGYYTKHDSIAFKKGRSGEFRSAIETYIRKMGMDLPNLKEG